MNRLAVTGFVIVALALATTVSAGEKGKKHGKCDKHALILNCLKADVVQEMKNTINSSYPECQEASGIPAGINITIADMATKEKIHKNKLCFIECAWKKTGLISGGTFKVDDFVKKNVKDELQATFLSTFQTCLTDKGVTTAYTATTADDGCKGIEKQAKCMKKAEKTCKGSDAGAATPSSGADEDEDEE